MTGGSFTPSNSNVLFKNILTVFLLILLLLMFVSAAFEFGASLIIYIILSVLAFFLAISGILHLSRKMRNNGVSEKINKIVTIFLVVAAAVFTVTITSVAVIILSII